MTTLPVTVAGNNTLFANFKVERVLGDDPQTKRIAVLGRFGGAPESAVVLLSRRHFAHDTLSSLLSEATRTQIDFENDIYSKYTGSAPPEHAHITIDLIYPATDKHINKHTTQQRFMVTETAEDYGRITLPYLLSIPPSSIQWVYNVLERKAEVERLIFDDPDPDVGFMMHPDLKWDQVQTEQLYCVAICHRRDIRSLRDLRREHLPLLQNIKSSATQAVQERYGVPPEQVRLYVHYQPSYYHFHVHVAHMGLEGSGVMAGKAVLLDDIIGNISLILDDYYALCSLTYSLAENDALYKLFKQHRQ